MPNESSGKDLQIIACHFSVRSLLHGVICITKCQLVLKCFCHILSFFFLSPGYLSVQDGKAVNEKLTITYFHETSHVYLWVGDGDLIENVLTFTDDLSR